MESILLNIIVRILFWFLCIYLTIYCLKQYITEKNAFFASAIHLFIILLSVMLMSGAPGDMIEGY